MAKIKFTAGRVDGYTCELGKGQSFLWDATAPGLGLRATAGGAKAYMFQAKLNGKAMRITIGDPATWSIQAAQAEARRLKVIIDNGQDPRQVKAAGLEAEQDARDSRAAEVKALKVETERNRITLGEVWPLYIKARKAKWGARHLQNHIEKSAPGGEAKKRGEGVTKAGPMAPLMLMPLIGLTAERIAEWLEHEAALRPTSSAHSYRLLRAFVRWTADVPAYRGIIAPDVCAARAVRDVLPKGQSTEGDSLQREQLPAWFEGIRRIGNPVIAAYLQGLLLTGARREELAALRWVDVDFQWNSLKLNDKIEDFRMVPLTPYVSHLLSGLPRRNEWVFSSLRAADGKLQESRSAHNKALATAGLPHVSVQGLRRSFGTLCEWVEMPSGISAQIMGHKPSALAEKHYRRRPLDLLRMWHTKIESWMLEQAGVQFTPAAPGLRVVEG
jgi:integrase